MIIEKPRALPRVVIATLALGGPSVLSGCGGGGGNANAVQNFCKDKVTCGYSGTAAACESYYNNFLSYYDTSCQGSIRSALACVANTGCSGDPSGCQPQISDAIGTCFTVDSAVADFCGQSSVCGQGGLANAMSCASFYSTNEAALYTSYGSDCLSAYDALLECASQLACGTTAANGCPSQVTDFNNNCT